MRDSAEIERMKVQNLRNQIQHRIKRNKEMKKQNAVRTERIKQMEGEMQRNEQFLVEYMQKLNRFNEIQKRFRAQCGGNHHEMSLFPLQNYLLSIRFTMNSHSS